jgi:cytochrome c-type biogenesis protein CcmH/NrfG
LNLYLASAYQHNKDIKKALKSLDEAEKLDPNNHMIKYQKANILYFDKKFDDSLKILMELKEKIPKEAPIHVLMGHIYKSKNELNKALTHYNTALDLDPKDFNMAKASIEKLMSEYDDGSNY